MDFEIENNCNGESGKSLGKELLARRKKLENLKNDGCDPFLYTFYARDMSLSSIRDNFYELENKTVTVAGRISSIRRMGKASFLDIRDETDKLQVYVKSEDISELESIKEGIELG